MEIINNLLPTNKIINSRIPSHKGKCLICGVESDTIFHALYVCKLEQEVFSHTKFFDLSSFFSFPDVRDFFIALKNVLGSNKFDFLLILLWNIWNRHNDLTHSGKYLNPVTVVWNTFKILNNYHTAIYVTPFSSINKLNCYWSPPRNAPFKLN